MRDIFTMHSICLEPGMVTVLRPSRPLRLQVSSGLVWLTVEGSLDDYHLSGGQYLTIPARARVVIESLHALSRVHIDACQQPWHTRLAATVSTLPAFLPGWRRRVQRQTCL